MNKHDIFSFADDETNKENETLPDNQLESTPAPTPAPKKVKEPKAPKAPKEPKVPKVPKEPKTAPKPVPDAPKEQPQNVATPSPTAVKPPPISSDLLRSLAPQKDEGKGPRLTPEEKIKQEIKSQLDINTDEAINEGFQNSDEELQHGIAEYNVIVNFFNDTKKSKSLSENSVRWLMQHKAHLLEAILDHNKTAQMIETSLPKEVGEDKKEERATEIDQKVSALEEQLAAKKEKLQRREMQLEALLAPEEDSITEENPSQPPTGPDKIEAKEAANKGADDEDGTIDEGLVDLPPSPEVMKMQQEISKIKWNIQHIEEKIQRLKAQKEKSSQKADKKNKVSTYFRENKTYIMQTLASEMPETTMIDPSMKIIVNQALSIINRMALDSQTNNDESAYGNINELIKQHGKMDQTDNIIMSFLKRLCENQDQGELDDEGLEGEEDRKVLIDDPDPNFITPETNNAEEVSALLEEMNRNVKEMEQERGVEELTPDVVETRKPQFAVKPKALNTAKNLVLNERFVSFLKQNIVSILFPDIPVHEKDDKGFHRYNYDNPEVLAGSSSKIKYILEKAQSIIQQKLYKTHYPFSEEAEKGILPSDALKEFALQAIEEVAGDIPEGDFEDDEALDIAPSKGGKGPIKSQEAKLFPATVKQMISAIKYIQSSESDNDPLAKLPLNASDDPSAVMENAMTARKILRMPTIGPEWRNIVVQKLVACLHYMRLEAKGAKGLATSEDMIKDIQIIIMKELDTYKEVLVRKASSSASQDVQMQIETAYNKTMSIISQNTLNIDALKQMALAGEGTIAGGKLVVSKVKDIVLQLVSCNKRMQQLFLNELGTKGKQKPLSKMEDLLRNRPGEGAGGADDTTISDVITEQNQPWATEKGRPDELTEADIDIPAFLDHLKEFMKWLKYQEAINNAKTISPEEISDADAVRALISSYEQDAGKDPTLAPWEWNRMWRDLLEAQLSPKAPSSPAEIQKGLGLKPHVLNHIFEREAEDPEDIRTKELGRGRIPTETKHPHPIVGEGAFLLRQVYDMVQEKRKTEMIPDKAARESLLQQYEEKFKDNKEQIEAMESILLTRDALALRSSGTPMSSMTEAQRLAISNYNQMSPEDKQYVKEIISTLKQMIKSNELVKMVDKNNETIDSESNREERFETFRKIVQEAFNKTNKLFSIGKNNDFYRSAMAMSLPIETLVKMAAEDDENDPESTEDLYTDEPEKRDDEIESEEKPKKGDEFEEGETSIEDDEAEDGEEDGGATGEDGEDGEDGEEAPATVEDAFGMDPAKYDESTQLTMRQAIASGFSMTRARDIVNSDPTKNKIFVPMIINILRKEYANVNRSMTTEEPNFSTKVTKKVKDKDDNPEFSGASDEDKATQQLPWDEEKAKQYNPELQLLNNRLKEIESKEEGMWQTINSLEEKLKEKLQKPSSELQQYKDRINEINTEGSPIDSELVKRYPEIGEILESIKKKEEEIEEIKNSFTKKYLYPERAKVQKLRDKIKRFKLKILTMSGDIKPEKEEGENTAEDTEDDETTKTSASKSGKYVYVDRPKRPTPMEPPVTEGMDQAPWEDESRTITERATEEYAPQLQLLNNRVKTLMGQRKKVLGIINRLTMEMEQEKDKLAIQFELQEFRDKIKKLNPRNRPITPMTLKHNKTLKTYVSIVQHGEREIEKRQSEFETRRIAPMKEKLRQVEDRIARIKRKILNVSGTAKSTAKSTISEKFLTDHPEFKELPQYRALSAEQVAKLPEARKAKFEQMEADYERAVSAVGDYNPSLAKNDQAFTQALKTIHDKIIEFKDVNAEFHEAYKKSIISDYLGNTAGGREAFSKKLGNYSSISQLDELIMGYKARISMLKIYEPNFFDPKEGRHMVPMPEYNEQWNTIWTYVKNLANATLNHMLDQEKDEVKRKLITKTFIDKKDDYLQSIKMAIFRNIPSLVHAAEGEQIDKDTIRIELKKCIGNIKQLVRNIFGLVSRTVERLPEFRRKPFGRNKLNPQMLGREQQKGAMQRAIAKWNKEVLENAIVNYLTDGQNVAPDPKKIFHTIDEGEETSKISPINQENYVKDWNRSHPNADPSQRMTTAPTFEVPSRKQSISSVCRAAIKQLMEMYRVIAFRRYRVCPYIPSRSSIVLPKTVETATDKMMQSLDEQKKQGAENPQEVAFQEKEKSVAYFFEAMEEEIYADKQECIRTGIIPFGQTTRSTGKENVDFTSSDIAEYRTKRLNISRENRQHSLDVERQKEYAADQSFIPDQVVDEEDRDERMSTSGKIIKLPKGFAAKAREWWHLRGYEPSTIIETIEQYKRRIGVGVRTPQDRPDPSVPFSPASLSDFSQPMGEAGITQGKDQSQSPDLSELTKVNLSRLPYESKAELAKQYDMSIKELMLKWRALRMKSSFQSGGGPAIGDPMYGHERWNRPKRARKPSTPVTQPETPTEEPAAIASSLLEDEKLFTFSKAPDYIKDSTLFA